MKVIFFQVQKEFLQIFRNKFLVRLIFIMPVLQLILLSNAASFEIKNLKLHLVDQDHSPASVKLASKLNGTGYFTISGSSADMASAYEAIEMDEADLILRIPQDFERDLALGFKPELQVLVNAINGTKAGLANAYTQAIIAGFGRQYMKENPQGVQLSMKQAHLVSEYHNWYNLHENYKVFMVPGILVQLVTMLAMLLTALNIVREKEIGTMEQLNVTPLKKIHFLLGKLIPFWILSIVVMGIGMLVGRVIFHVPFEGSVMLTFIYVNLYILAVSGLGMFVSIISRTQQQAIFTSFFFIMIFILMSGLFTAIENMPEWAQLITRLNPLSYFIQFMRMMMLKGSSFTAVKDLFLSIIIYGIITNALAFLFFRKSTG